MYTSNLSVYGISTIRSINELVTLLLRPLSIYTNADSYDPTLYHVDGVSRFLI